MEHARKMALVDPRLLDTLRSHPPSTDTLGKKVQALDDEMMTILNRKDLDDGTKVTLYNQVLQRYNVLSDKHVKEPVGLVAVNESVSGPGVGVGPGPGPGSEGAVRARSSGLEATVVDTVPKTMQAKARLLMEHLKRDVAWTAVVNLYTRVCRLPEVTWWISLVICSVRERPIQQVGSHSHDNSAPSTYPWSWSVTLPGEPTYARRRRPLPLVDQLLLLLVLLLLLLVVHEDH